MPRIRLQLRRLVEQAPLRLVFLLVLCALPAIAGVAWWYSAYWADEKAHEIVRAQAAELEERRHMAAQDFDSAFRILRGLPDYLADDSMVVEAVTSRDARQIQLINHFLARYATSFEVDAVFMLDAGGTCIASSNYNLPESFIGQQYSDRLYFTEALFGRRGGQYAVGRVTNTAGFYFSTPIFHHEERVGVMVVKINASRIESKVQLHDAFIADEQGVVVLAEHPQYMFKLMPEAPLLKQPASYRNNRYRRINFDPLPLAPAPDSSAGDLRLLDGKLVVLSGQPMMGGAFSLYVFSSARNLQDLTQQQFKVFALTGGAGVVLVGLLSAAALYVIHFRKRQQRIEHTNVALSRLNRVLQERASHDPLTGCPNRWSMDEEIRREIARSKRYGESFCIGMLDIDHFKQVNDAYGHQVGDQALRHLVEQVVLRIRQSDVFARYGGEEFVLVMPETPLEQAVQLIDRIRTEVEQVPVQEVIPPLYLHFSAGVVGYVAGMSAADMLQSADVALYAAKQEGRNRVLAASVDNTGVLGITKSGL